MQTAMPGNLVLAGFLPIDAPCFVDGSQHLKQNLLFCLRAATFSQQYNEYSLPYQANYYDNGFISGGTNCAESSIFHLGYQYEPWLNGPMEFNAMDDLWPFTVNYQLHQSLYDPNHPDVPSGFVWQTNLVTVPAPAVLDIGDPYWISQGFGNLADLAAGTNDGYFYLQSSARNLFGLAFTDALVNEGGWQYFYLGQFGLPIMIDASFTTLAPGNSIGETNVSVFFSQTTDPILQADGYYFAPVTTPGTMWPNSAPLNQPAPLPINPSFAVTNQTPAVMFGSVGQPMILGCLGEVFHSGRHPNQIRLSGPVFFHQCFQGGCQRQCYHHQHRHRLALR